MRKPLLSLIAGLLVAPALVVASPASPASAAPAPETGSLVKETAPATTPQVLNGATLSITRVGDTMVIGGSFTQARDVGSAVTLTRNRLLAFDVNTGKINTSFAPDPDGNVNVVIPGPNNTVYVGGAFNNIGAVARRRVAQLRLSDGAVVSTFNAGTVAGNVNDLRLYNNRLFVGGMFTHIANNAQLGLATVNPTTGAFDPYVRQVFAGQQNGGYTGIAHFDISPQADRLLAIGNFATVDGSSRRQVVMLDLAATKATVANWQTPYYEANCSSSFNSYMRDLDISPDGTFAVITTTGAYGGADKACDTSARFEVGATGTGLQPSWVDTTGGDTTYAVEITDSVVYTGGHARWQNNPNAGDRAGAGAVSRPGIAALDPVNGMPLSWNPTRDRGVGVYDFRADDKGLWVGSDTEHIGPDYGYRPRIALLPTGGTTFVKPVATTLPNNLYSLQSGQNLVRRFSDGTTFGGVTDVPDVTRAGATLKGAFMLGGELYTAWSDQAFLRQTFNGTSYGPTTPVNTHNALTPLTAWNTEISQATSMTYQRGRIYYTLSTGNSTNDNRLYYRYFTPENNVVGAKRYTASNAVTGLAFTSVRGAFLTDDFLYTTDTSGNLRRTAWNDPAGPSGTPAASSTTVVSGPSKGDGRTWPTGPMFLYQDAAGQPAGGPPNAAFTSSCTSRTCDFDSSTTTGDVASYAWTFGDGSTSTAAKPQHVYAADGTYTVTLTVTSSEGATSTATRTVAVTRTNALPTASMTTSCNELVCSFNGTGSSDSDGTIAGYSWNFGDGTPAATGATVNHTYANPGTYTATLTVTDNDGGTGTTTRSVEATNTRVDFVASATTNGNRSAHTVTVPAAVRAGDLMVLSFTVNSSAPAVTAPAGWTQREDVSRSDTHGIVWTRTATAADLGQTVTVGTGTTYAKSDLALAAYRSSTGIAQVLSSAISFDTASTTDHVSPQVAAATADSWLVTYFARESSSTTGWEAVAGQTKRGGLTGTGGGNVAATLVDSNGPVPSGTRGGLTGSLSAASGNVVSWSMRIGPGGTAPAPDPDPVPNAKPTAVVTAACADLVCSLGGGDSMDSDGTVAGYSWNFGDGTPAATGVNVQHTYANPGSYTVTLTVTDNDGATGTATRTVQPTAPATDTDVRFVAGASSNGNRAAHSVTVPAGVAEGDLLVLSFTVNSSAPAVTAPAGWTQREDVSRSDTHGVLWTKTATAADLGQMVTVGTGTTYAKSDLALVAYRSTTGTARVVSSAISFDTAATADHVSPQVAAATADTWLVTYFARESSSTASWQPVSGQSVRAGNTGTGGGNIAAILVDSNGPVPAGTRGGLTGSLTAASSNVVSWSLRIGPS